MDFAWNKQKGFTIHRETLFHAPFDFRSQHFTSILTDHEKRTAF